MIELAIDGDPAVERVIADAGVAIGRALAALCNAINPRAIIVGGDLIEAGPILLTSIEAAIARYALPDAAEAVHVIPGKLGPRATLMGTLATILADHDRLRSRGLLALVQGPRSEGADRDENELARAANL
jgi:predicted NBD/HSP70 family sugar kinase